MSTQIEALRDYLESAIGTMAITISQYEAAVQQHHDVVWPYPGTFEEAKGKEAPGLQGDPPDRRRLNLSGDSCSQIFSPIELSSC